MDESPQSELPASLERAAKLLREEPPVREPWRAELLSRLTSAADDRPAAAPRRWSISPLAAMAAGLVCAAVGASVALAVMRATPPAVSELASRAASASETTPIADPRAAPRVRFALVAPTAVHVSIVGDFDQWNPSALPLRRLPDGRTWEVEVPLAPGRYTYAFVVDGRVARDSAAAETANDGYGSSNSVVLVKGS